MYYHGEGAAQQFESAPGPFAISRTALLELARFRPSLATGRFEVLEPSTGRFETLELNWLQTSSWGISGLAPRVLLLREPAGRNRGFAAWLGHELVAFRDGPSGPVFRRDFEQPGAAVESAAVSARLLE